MLKYCLFEYQIALEYFWVLITLERVEWGKKHYFLAILKNYILTFKFSSRLEGCKLAGNKNTW